jgi:hypothetical protein
MMILASVGGNRVPVIAKLDQADEDTVREVIHRFNEIGLAWLDPQWREAVPCLLGPDDKDLLSRRPLPARPSSVRPSPASRSADSPPTRQSPRPDDPHRYQQSPLPPR